MHSRGKRTVGKTGIVYRSALECRVLDKYIVAGALDYECVRLDYNVPKTYTPDALTRKGVHIEVKGYFPPADRTKTLLVRKRHPDIDLRFVFDDANLLLSKQSRTTYGEWCDRHGFLWAVGHIPLEWLV